MWDYAAGSLRGSPNPSYTTAGFVRPMDAPRPTRADRDREAREVGMRHRRTSVRLGTSGIVLLFLGAIGTILSPDAVSLLLVVMIAGLVLIVAAFLEIRRAGGTLGLRELTGRTKGL